MLKQNNLSNTSHEMKNLKLIAVVLFTMVQSYGQQKADNKKAINDIINTYIRTVIERDSVAFYDLFNDGRVTWCASLKDRSQAKEIEAKGLENARNGYFEGSHKDFFRSLFRYQSTEDKFDNITIIEDGTVASVTMDYSFWANNKMTNWGGKYLTLIKRDGKWKIASVIYSLELINYFPQPSIEKRQKEKRKAMDL